MSITDELRTWVTGANPAVVDGCSISVGTMTYGCKQALLAIADRIDAEHERTFRNLTDALHKQEDATRELDEKSMLLPVDADGVPIHVGDMMWQKDRITKRACKAIMGDAYVMLDGIQGAVYAKGLTHYHAPTVEDVLREFFSRYVRYIKTNPKEEDDAIIAEPKEEDDAIIAEFAAKLRLAGDAE